MDEWTDRYPDREAFDKYWNENYQELVYDDVKEKFEDFVNDAKKHIFKNDYEEKGQVSREDFIDNLNQTAEFMFQDALTEAFYDKNPELYETAFALYEEAKLSGDETRNVAQIFHEEYHRLYQLFLLEMYDRLFPQTVC